MRAGSGDRPWWSDALNDPWRNPDTHAVIMTTSDATPPPADPTPDIPLGPPRSLGLVAVVSLIVGLLAGGLGAAIGYTAATRRENPQAALGANARAAAPPQRAPESLAALVARVMPSVVTVMGVGSQGESLGSGFFVTTDGYVLTNEHVLADVPDEAVRVTLSDARTVTAHVVGRDPESDLAVLKVDQGDFRPVVLADSDSVAVGDPVIAVGAPLALAGTVTSGIVSALDRTIETRDVGGVQRYYAAIQTDAAVNRGNSGGPLFDLAGRVIGINSVIKSLVEDGEEAGNIGIAFAIPINQASRIASEIIDTGKARRTIIGAEIEEFRGPGGGARLTAVSTGGPAAAAGLRNGDVVLRLGKHLIEAPHDLIALVRRFDPGTVVTLVYRRGASTLTASVTLAADAN
jgi:putative serine protease PepD